ncbi:MAG: hypothetical protein HQ495_05375 [Alphaproteobacteria bacterium]|nr:hypothetical protein [Alphaproteobacteria bacterium]
MNIPNRITVDTLDQWPIGEIIALPAEELAQLQIEVEEHFRKAKLLRDWFGGALTQKYADRALAERVSANKDTGTVRFQDGNVIVVTDLAKRVDWDQAKLAELVARIAASEDDPAQYVDTVYRVSERKYGAWPAAIRKDFEPARTVRPGSLKVDLVSQEVEP